MMANDSRDSAAGTNQHASEEVCNDVLLGLVSRPEVERWGAHFAECLTCEQRFQQLAGEFEVARSHEMPHANITPIPQLARRHLSRRWRLVAALAAASIVFAFLGAWPLWFEDSPPGDYWLPMERQEIALRSNSAPGADGFTDALRAYSQRDAVSAARQLQVPLEDEGHDLLRQVYLASALALSGDPQAALDVLEALQPQTLPQPWKNRSLWVRYGCLQTLGQQPAARRILDKLAKESDHIGALARQEQQRLH